MKNELKKLLTNPEVFPVELTFASGEKLTITHPDFVYFSGGLEQHCFVLQQSGNPFEWIIPEHITKIRASAKKGWWSHFFKGSKE